MAIAPKNLAGRLKANDDALQSFDLPHHVGRGMDDFFERWSVDANGHPTRLPVSDVWDRDGMHVRATNFNAYNTGPIVSRLTKRWPVFAADIKLPTLEADVLWKLAFETGHQGTAGDITFMPDRRDQYTGTSYADTQATFSAHTRGNHRVLDVTSLLPSDYDSAEHVYRLFRYRGGAWLTIDNELRAVILDGVPEGLPKWENNPPYALGSLNESMGSELGFKTSAWSTDEKEFTFPLTTEERCFGMFEGQELPPRQFPLYTESTSTKWQGSSLSGTVDSHPVPVWGYPNKTLYFKSAAAGTLRVQVYAGGGWVTRYEKSLTAGDLFVYNLDEEVPIARCEYVATNSDAIDIAEWYLS